MPKLYADENFPQPAVLRLRELGIDVWTSLEAGMSGRAVPDEEVLVHATSDGRALITLNRRHFIRIHESGPKEHAGIVVCHFDPDFEAMANRIHAALAANPDLRGQLLRARRQGS